MASSSLTPNWWPFQKGECVRPCWRAPITFLATYYYVVLTHCCIRSGQNRSRSKILRGKWRKLFRFAYYENLKYAKYFENNLFELVTGGMKPKILHRTIDIQKTNSFHMTPKNIEFLQFSNQLFHISERRLCAWWRTQLYFRIPLATSGPKAARQKWGLWWQRPIRVPKVFQWRLFTR